ncbi:LysR family transcriptional regulator [uncultured Xylophilus sp.]|uniref:LysR family transcriptional regulator n=1 Tax=uncultured Xylophilus sp. TaxID=296832 RepID=UPI0025EE5E9B|nr:LysR family transcriptional regulator [uncultured Xylophilus sp.]
MDRLQSMRVFQRVVDEGGFAAAARALDLSPAAVTRLVGDLERHLGTRLLQRTTRRFALTEAGESYLGRVRSILQDIDDAEAGAAASTRELRGTLRMVATPLLASSFLAPRVEAWRRRQPGVVLEIVTDALPQSRVEEFDLSFLVVDEGYDANIVARPLWRGDWVLCAAPAYLERAGTPHSPEDLAHHDHLRHTLRLSRRMRLLPLQGVAGPVEVDAPAILQSGSADVLYRAAVEGAGIAVMSRLLITPQLESGALVHLLPDWIFGRFVLYAAMPTRQHVPARTRAFLDFLAEEREAPPPSIPL